MTRELDSRISDGIQVRLLWDSRANSVSVAVSDTKTGDAFELPVSDGSNALEIFHHPYVYRPEPDRPAGARAPRTTEIAPRRI